MLQVGLRNRSDFRGGVSLHCGCLGCGTYTRREPNALMLTDDVKRVLTSLIARNTRQRRRSTLTRRQYLPLWLTHTLAAEQRIRESEDRERQVLQGYGSVCELCET